MELKPPEVQDSAAIPPVSTSSSVPATTPLVPHLTTSVVTSPAILEKKEEKEGKKEDSEDEDNNEILEESPCGRWQKRREQVKQRDIPGIDAAFLAMDSEEGVEVVWNEVQFSERKNFKLQEDKIKAVFDNLTLLRHANLVKFHSYWTDTKADKSRVVFITEYMSAGSITQYLKRTNKNLPKKMWKKWCRQILAGLSYLHTCTPPIIHGNLSCNTIFIQQNGLIKIGCVAPDTIHHHVKTFRDNLKNMHYIAPEYEFTTVVTPAVDIYSFGVCALEMAAVSIQSNGDNSAPITLDILQKATQALEDPLQKDFIEKCLTTDPSKRPNAHDLFFHPALFEVPLLKTIAAHVIVNNKHFEALAEDAFRLQKDKNERVIAEIIHPGDKPPIQFKLADVAALELDKFLEDVRNGIYPLNEFSHPVETVLPSVTHPTVVRAASPAEPKTLASPSESAPVEEELPAETRRVVGMQAELKPGEPGLHLNVTLRLEDRMNRSLACDITDADTAELLAQELVSYGFINREDHVKLAELIADVMAKFWASEPPVSVTVGQAVV